MTRRRQCCPTQPLMELYSVQVFAGRSHVKVAFHMQIHTVHTNVTSLTTLLQPFMIINRCFL